jgi:hypothetical protein
MVAPNASATGMVGSARSRFHHGGGCGWPMIGGEPWRKTT